jgi:hypothetical protein
MDGTHTIYRDEESANIEMTNCLKLYGHIATYPATKLNGRTADICVDKYAIIEGKLDPNRSEIDRLIGQTLDYLKSPHYIFIVIYGKISQIQLERINDDLCEKYPDRIELVYLKEPQRIRTYDTKDSLAWAER